MNTQPKEKKKTVQKESHPTLATFYFLFDSFDIISEYVRSDLSLAWMWSFAFNSSIKLRREDEYSIFFLIGAESGALKKYIYATLF